MTARRGLACAAAVALALAAGPDRAVPAKAPAPRDRALQIVFDLAHPRMEGRGVGTAGVKMSVVYDRILGIKIKKERCSK